MSKKHKRQSRRASTTTARTAAQSTSPTPSSGVVKSAESEFRPDYSQTIKDLKRIGTLAGTFFAILVILSFFLR